MLKTRIDTEGERMFRDRGVVQVPVVGENPRYCAKTTGGLVAFDITLNAGLYSPERQERILAFLVKHLLDPVDPPLQLVPGCSESTGT